MGTLKKATTPDKSGDCSNDVDNPITSCYPSNLIVEFRPHRPNYNGEFGFDWLRVEDRDIGPQMNKGGFLDEPYEKCILGGYGHSDDKQAYNALKKEYESFRVKERIGYQDPTYYIPYLNLFSKVASDQISGAHPDLAVPPPFEARLRLIFYAAGEKADEVVFEFPDEFEIDGKKSPYVWDKTDDYSPKTPPENRAGSSGISVKCLKDISSKSYIKVYSIYKKGSDKEKKILAGKLCLLPNSDKYRKTLKIALISVVTNVEDDPSKVRTGVFLPEEIKRLYHVLYQALVVPVIKNDLTLDLRKNKDWQKGGKYITSSDSFNLNLNPHANLKSAFIQAKPENRQYNTHFLAFAVGLKDGFLLGSAQGLGIQTTVNTLLASEKDVATTAHEVLHGLGISHTHFHGSSKNLHQNAKYVYQYAFDNQARATDNIMSYSRHKLVTWRWQWEIIHANL